MRLFLALLVALFQTTGSQTFVPQAALATVDGIAVRRDTTEPIPDVGIALTKVLEGAAAQKSNSPRAYTDAGGRFHIDNLEPGRYRLTVSATGYGTQEFGQRVIDGAGTPLDLSAGQIRKDVVVRLIPGGTISGQLRTPLGRPIVGVRVQLIQRLYLPDREQLPLPVGFAESNDLGEYRFHGVKPGHYVGDYRASVRTALRPYAHSDPELQRQRELNGRPVHVTELSKESLELRAFD